MKKYIIGIVTCLFFILFFKNYDEQLSVTNNVENKAHKESFNQKYIKDDDFSLLNFQKDLNRKATEIDIEIYRTCRKCLKRLSDIILSKKIELIDKKNAAIILARISSKDSILILFNSLNKSGMKSEDLQIIIDAAIVEIKKENTILLTKFLVDEAIDEKQLKLNQVIKNKIYEHLSTNTSNELKNELIDLFKNTENNDVKNNVIDLENIEVSREIFTNAYNDGNQYLQQKIIDKLAFSHDNKSLDLLLEIGSTYYPDNDSWLSENVNEWLNANLYNHGYNHLLNYFNDPNISKGVRDTLLDTLEDSLPYIQNTDIKSKIEAAVKR